MAANFKIVEDQTETLEKLDAKTIFSYFEKEFNKIGPISSWWNYIKPIIQDHSGRELLSPSFLKKLEPTFDDAVIGKVEAFIQVLKKFKTKLEGKFNPYEEEESSVSSTTTTTTTTTKEEMEIESKNQQQQKLQEQEEVKKKSMPELKKFVTTAYRQYAFNLPSEPTQNLLYFREECSKLWEVLENSQIRPATTLIGMQGTGKSSLVWYWCLHYCTQNPTHTLVWIQYKEDVTVVVMISNLKLYFQTSMLSIPVDFSALWEAHVVVFDGIRKLSHHDNAFVANGLKNARKILVSSGHMENDFLRAKSPENNKPYQVYKVYYWRLHEYKAACQNPEFFSQVFPNLVIDEKIPLNVIDEDEIFDIDPSSTNVNNSSINVKHSKMVSLSDFNDDKKEYKKNMKLVDIDSLLRLKHALAGGSARFMFEYTPTEVRNAIDTSVQHFSSNSVKQMMGSMSE